MQYPVMPAETASARAEAFSKGITSVIQGPPMTLAASFTLCVATSRVVPCISGTAAYNESHRFELVEQATYGQQLGS